MDGIENRKEYEKISMLKIKANKIINWSIGAQTYITEIEEMCFPFLFEYL